MINFHVTPFCAALDSIRQIISWGEAGSKVGKDIVREARRAKIKNKFEIISMQCSSMMLERTGSRLMRLSRMLDRVYDYDELSVEFKALLEAIEDDCQCQKFYHYRQDKGLMVLKIEDDWKIITDAFPGCKDDASAATDCYALGHHTASVFHSMRVVEFGLRAVAKERRVELPKNKPIEWGTWLEIIRELDGEIKVIGGKKAGAAKDAALEFYSGARADLNGFKDEYRNLVMHVRAKYDELQALAALRKVHSFMERISAKVDQRHHRIRWGLK